MVPASEGRAGGATRRTVVWAVAVPVALICCFLLYGWLLLRRPLDSEGSEQAFVVARGQTLEAVHDELLQRGLISPRAPILLWARLTGGDRRIKLGDYDLSAAQSPLEILETLVAGRTTLVSVTIPEGMTQSRILTLLSEVLGTPAEALAEAAADSVWLRRLGLPVLNLEGYLFPDTYCFDRETPARRVLGTIVAACLQHLDRARQERADSLELSLHEVMTLASIIEAEAMVAEERARISAVYHNRLRRGWLLQADPTVAHAIKRSARWLSTKDLKVDSPYNTYLYPGLPPGPICSPGLASLDAALQPLEGCPDLYFVARGDGTHVFSRSLEAHNRARTSVRSRR